MTETIQIGNRTIGAGHPPYIIAEACINHEGDIAIAREMVYMARAMGADAIKFQYHVLDDEMLRETPQSENFKESLYDALNRTNLKTAEHVELKSLCERIGIAYLCTPFSRKAADILEDEVGVDVFKVGSGELTNLPLQEHIARKGKPMIVSTGMSTVEEVSETVDLLRSIGVPFALTHCVSAYPCPYERVNLGMITRYREMFGVPVGLSDHSVGIYTSLGAVAFGASLIEKHFTFDRTAEGPDHKSSIEPDELGQLVKGSRAVYLAMGDRREIFPEERQIVAWARESVVSVMDIPKGTPIATPMVSVKRPSPGEGAIAAKHLKQVIGKIANADIRKDHQILWSELT